MARRQDTGTRQPHHAWRIVDLKGRGLEHADLLSCNITFFYHQIVQIAMLIKRVSAAVLLIQSIRALDTTGLHACGVRTTPNSFSFDQDADDSAEDLRYERCQRANDLRPN